MSQLTLDEFSCAPCAACGHARAFHRPNGGGCFGELNGNSLSSSGIDLENFQERKEMQVECWCWRYETDAAAGIDSILKGGDAEALVAATNTAVERGDSFNAERLLDSYVRKVHGHRDPEWVRAIERSIARLQSQPNPAGNASSPSSQSLSAEDADSQRLAGDAEEKKRRNSQPIRPLSKTPAPIIPVRGSGMAHAPKPTQSILDWPPNYPDDLRPETTVTIGKALKKFPVQTQTLGLCKYVVSKLTPHFCGAVQQEALKPHVVLSVTADLVHYLAVANGNDADDGCRLELEIRKSDEWLDLAKGIERESRAIKYRLLPNPRQHFLGAISPDSEKSVDGVSINWPSGQDSKKN